MTVNYIVSNTVIDFLNNKSINLLIDNGEGFKAAVDSDIIDNNSIVKIIPINGVFDLTKENKVVRIHENTQNTFKVDFDMINEDELILNSLSTWNEVYNLYDYYKSRGSEPVYTSPFIASVKVEDIKRTITLSDLNYIHSKNATIWVNNIEINEKYIINNGDSITIKANSGWQFYSESVYSFDAYGGIWYLTLNGKFNEANSTITSLNQLERKGQYLFYVDTVQKLPDFGGTGRIYKLTTEQLKQVITDRFTYVTDDGKVIDYGQFFIGLLNLPFEIDVLPNTEKVILGNYKTNIDANVISYPLLTVDMGIIDLSSLNNLDIEISDFNLYLPYYGIYKINETIKLDDNLSIKYLINLYNSKGKIIINNGDMNLSIINVDFNFNIPYSNLNQTPNNNSFNNYEIGGFNDINNVYLEVKRYDLQLNAMITKSGILSNENYIELDRIKLPNIKYIDDYENIINILQKGVYINE